jgi:hypothetical protein
MPIRVGMQHGTWTFAKGDQQLVLERRESEDGHLLTITGREGVRPVAFADIGALVVFQSDAEEFLVRTGWTLRNFSPDRRHDQERRLFPREGCDRRRWWTDSLTPRQIVRAVTGS